MSDPTTVKRALARLARGDVSDRAVVDLGTAAVRDVDRAATFAAVVGVERLERAVESAERSGDRETARRGQRALAAFEWFERAADTDHFRSARGTHLPSQPKATDT